jgi:molybdopterin/thiamine biosynthesis adenylyltransferase
MEPEPRYLADVLERHSGSFSEGTVNSLFLTESQCSEIEANLAATPDLETVLIVSGSVRSQGDVARFVVRDLDVPDAAAYNRRSAIAAELTSQYLGPVVRRRRGVHGFIGFIHCHPGRARPKFSALDDRGEGALAPFLERQFDSSLHVSMIVGAEEWTARQIGTSAPLRVVRVGRHITELTAAESISLELSHERQVQVFGAEGQRALARLRFSVVGLGGTGSLVAQALAYLGVRQLRLLDFDTVELSNLNRLIGARPVDVGKSKVSVVAAHLNAIAPDCKVDAVVGDVTGSDVALSLLEDDIVFSCTDSHGSRAVLNQLAYQYYLPCFDTGVSIHSAADGHVQRVTGRAQMLSPGLGCLTCGSLLDPDEVRRDLMTPAQRRADPYFVGQRIPQPAVVSINSTAASLSVTMALAAISRFPVSARMQVYDAMQGTVRSTQISPVADCIVCSKRGALGRGASWHLPTRSS